MKIAIVIGVSEYKNVHNLPGCESDANAILNLLKSSDSYEDILYISSNTDSTNIKDKLSSFVRNNEGKDIDEVFFYFSGHGLFEDNEFYYILSDYDSVKKKQTSLENTELDAYLRSLNAKLSVKIVDACQAGTAYIKDVDAFKKYINQSEGKFNNCYFMYSSQNTQSSYLSGKLSDFTSSFLNACIVKVNQDIRYKDIIDFISDDFESNKQQTPFFVVQGNYTELFCKIDHAKALELKSLFLEEKNSGLGKKLSRLEKIKEDADSFVSKEKILESIDELGKFIYGELFVIENMPYSEEIKELYSYIAEYKMGEIDIPKVYIAETLRRSGDYLVSYEYITKKRKVPKHSISTLYRSILGSYGDKNEEYVVEEYQALNSAKSDIEFSYDYINLQLESKYPNINDSRLLVIPFVSRQKIIIFTAFIPYEIKGFDTRSIVRNKIEWTHFEEKITNLNEIKDKLNSVLRNFIEFTFQPINEKFGGGDVDNNAKPTKKTEQNL